MIEFVYFKTSKGDIIKRAKHKVDSGRYKDNDWLECEMNGELIDQSAKKKFKKKSKKK